jgi:hypothetical protein
VRDVTTPLPAAARVVEEQEVCFVVRDHSGQTNR